MTKSCASAGRWARATAPGARALKIWMAIAIALLLGWVGVAAGELAPTEKAQIAQLVGAISDLHAAMQYLGFAVQEDTTGRYVLGTALWQGTQAHRECGRALNLLLDVATEQEGTVAYSNLRNASRAVRVNTAWFYLDRCVHFIDEAGSVLPPNATSDNVRRAREIWFLSARDRAASINRAYTYESPLPPSYPTIVGPHGFYDDAQWYFWRSGWYATDALEYLLPAYQSRTLTPDQLWPIYAVIDRVTELLSTLAYRQARMAAVAFTEAEETQNPFWRTLAVLERLTAQTYDSAAQRLHEAQSSLAILPATYSRVRIADAWRHLDFGVWAMMSFPNCSPAEHPNGCGGR